VKVLAAEWRRHSAIPLRDCKVEFGRHYALGRIGCPPCGHRPGGLRPSQRRALEAGYESLGIAIGLRTSGALSAMAGRRVTGVGATYCPIIDELVIVWDLPPADAGEPRPSPPR
jgi:hypothetical protein